MSKMLITLTRTLYFPRNLSFFSFFSIQRSRFEAISSLFIDHSRVRPDLPHLPLLALREFPSPRGRESGRKTTAGWEEISGRSVARLLPHYYFSSSALKNWSNSNDRNYSLPLPKWRLRVTMRSRVVEIRARSLAQTGRY